MSSPPQQRVTPVPRVAFSSTNLYHAALGLTWIAIAAPLLVWGLDFYSTPIPLRATHPQNDLFSPTGVVGNRLGIIGTLMISGGVAMYIVRKRWRRLHGFGKLRNWLSFHIWLCTLGPFLILLHTSFKVGGIVSIAFWSMVVVVASGVLGRYVYVHLPKADNGRFLELREIEAEHSAIRDQLVASGVEEAALRMLAVPVPERTPGPIQALSIALRAGRGTVPGLTGPDAATVAALARRYRRLALDRALMLPFGRVFRYWHAIHLPLAIVMALVLLVHIVVAILFGYAWTPSSP